MFRLNTLRGIVRPVTTLALVGAVIAGFFAGKLDADVFVRIAELVITFWFVQRQQEKRG